MGASLRSIQSYQTRANVDFMCEIEQVPEREPRDDRPNGHPSGRLLDHGAVLGGPLPMLQSGGIPRDAEVVMKADIASGEWE